MAAQVLSSVEPVTVGLVTDQLLITRLVSAGVYTQKNILVTDLLKSPDIVAQYLDGGNF